MPVRISGAPNRTTATPYHYWFALKGVRCLNRVSAVLVSVPGGRVDDRWGAKIELASEPLAVHQYYSVTLQAVRYGGHRKVLARGRLYRVKLYMPGTEVKWTPITGVTLPEVAHSTAVGRL